MTLIPTPEAPTNAAQRLLANKERVLAVWEERLRNEVAAAGREPHMILINTLPAVLDQLADALSPDHPRLTATQGNTMAQEHGGERVRLTHFGLEDLIAEYKILRQVVFAILEESGALSQGERDTLNASLDQLIGEACSGYVLVQSAFRDQFFATIAHDLRNPLNAARAATSLIVNEAPSANVTNAAKHIADNIGRVDRMVQDLLDAMRVQTGARLQLEIKPCDLTSLVRETVARLQVEHNRRLVLIAPEPVRGFLAPETLQRAVENLVDNAVKYGVSSEPITISVVETHGRAILRVHNHGAPIPAERRETLFRAFARLNDAEHSGKKGWGLGLAQVRAVAEAHGGSIGVDSLPGRGTTFAINIPLDARPLQTKPITPHASRDPVRP